MPLSSRINKSEPKKKRAKTELRKSTTPPPVTTSNNQKNSDSTTTEQTKTKTRSQSRSKLDLNSTQNSVELNESVNEKPSTTTTTTTTRSKKTTNTKQSIDKKVNGASNTTANTTNGHTDTDTVMTDISNINDATTNTTTSSSKPTDLIDPISRPTKPGLVLACGENLSNQLGLGGEINDRKKPQLVKDLPENIIQIASGGMHSACLTQDGIVYTFGCNDEFALGRDNDDEIDKVDLPEKIIEITAGDSHTAGLSETGVVYAWGTFRDGSGVLGLEQKKIAKTPMKFKLKDKIAKISSGADHMVFLTFTGEVYTAGNSEHGQLGRVSKYNSCRGGRRGYDMILVPGLVRFAKRKELQGHKQIEDVWTSSYCTYLKVKDSDLVIGFGLNNCYQLGIEDCENRYQPDILQSLKFEGKLKKVIGGMHHTIFLDSKGYVYSMGSHRYGCLGLGKVEADVKEPTRISDLKDIIDIAANTNVSYAIDKNGKAFSWGTNYSKQLGQDTEEDYLQPTVINSKQLDIRDVYTVSVGGQHSLFVASEEKEMDSD